MESVDALKILYKNLHFSKHPIMICVLAFEHISIFKKVFNHVDTVIDLKRDYCAAAFHLDQAFLNRCGSEYAIIYLHKDLRGREILEIIFDSNLTELLASNGIGQLINFT